MSDRKEHKGGLWETLRTIVYAVGIAVIIRTVAFEPFNIPSGSMLPTLLVGDYLFVSKYSYGYSKHSLPASPGLFKGRILERLPERGDVIVFKTPSDNSTDYIKRVVGLPGERIQMKNSVLHINDVPVKLEQIEDFVVGDSPGLARRFEQFFETLPNGRRHRILNSSYTPGADETAVFVVPAGHYFMMGDNRDESADSRFAVQAFGGVGFVPAENLVGRAEFLFFSTDGSAGLLRPWLWPESIRWNRIFRSVQAP